MPKSTCYLPGNHLDDEKAHEFLQNTIPNQQSFSDLTAMDASVSTKGQRVTGVPIVDDAWVTESVVEKVEAVILDVGKIDHVLTDGIMHYHMLRFCQNTRPGFLARSTPTPLIMISKSLESLETETSVILESMCTKGTGGTHTDCASEF